MRLRTLRLEHRIVIPFVAVAVLTTAAAAYVAVSTLSRTLASRVDEQSRNAAALVSQSDFALNPQILASIKKIVGADVVTFSSDGRVIATTVEGGRTALLSSLTSPDIIRAVTRSQTDTIQLPVACDVPCRVAFHRVSGRAGTFVAIVADTSAVIRATESITRTVLLAALLSVIVMIAVSQLIARRVTRPISALVAFTQKVGSGDTASRAPEGGDEVGRLGAAFNAMLDRLERSQRALVRSEKLGLAGLLAARVAHDIRNPLSSIKMQTQLLQSRTRGDADNQAMTQAVLADIQTVEHVVRDLLEVARPGDLRLKPTRLDALVEELLTRLEAQFRYRKIDTEIVMPGDLATVQLDPDRFGQALLNVLLNAADAMPSGGRLRVEGRHSAPSTIELDVCDDGVGIDPAILPHVFDPFVSTKRDGVGLGLVNAKAVVESHGGRIEIAARAPRGTRVTIALPLGNAVHG
jgi:signal transduction histidine kinase